MRVKYDVCHACCHLYINFSAHAHFYVCPPASTTFTLQIQTKKLTRNLDPDQLRILKCITHAEMKASMVMVKIRLNKPESRWTKCTGSGSLQTVSTIRTILASHTAIVSIFSSRTWNTLRTISTWLKTSRANLLRKHLASFGKIKFENGPKWSL